MFAVALVILVCRVPSVGAQTDTFRLVGQLEQGTADGDPIPAGLPLRLNLLDEDGASQAVFTTSNAADGGFSFDAVPINPEALYVVSTVWAGIDQSSLPRAYDEIGEVYDFPLYETTPSIAAVVANRGNVRIEFTEANTVGVQMLLELNYVNLGQRIVVPQEGQTLTVELPVGALAVAPEEAPGEVQRYRAVPRIDGLPIPGIVDTQPIVPGWPNNLRASFFVPYEDGAVIDMRFPFAADNLGVFVREDTVSLESDLLSLSDEQETTSGRTYFIYELTDPLAPRQPFIFTLLGEPIETVRRRDAIATESDDSAAPLLAIFALGVLMIFGALILWFVRTRQAESQSS